MKIKEYIEKQFENYNSTVVIPLIEEAEINGNSEVDLSPYAKKTEIPDVSGFAKKSEIPTLPNMEEYAKKTELPDLSGFATKEEIPTIPDLTEYAKKTELPSLEGVAYEKSLADYVKKNDIDSIIFNGEYKYNLIVPDECFINEKPSNQVNAPFTDRIEQKGIACSNLIPIEDGVTKYKLNVQDADWLYLRIYFYNSDAQYRGVTAAYSFDEEDGYLLIDMSNTSGATNVSKFCIVSNIGNIAEKRLAPADKFYEKSTTSVEIPKLVLSEETKNEALTEYAKKTDIPTMPDLSSYALKTDIKEPDLSSYAKKSEINDIWTAQNELSSSIEPILNNISVGQGESDINLIEPDKCKLNSRPTPTTNALYSDSQTMNGIMTTNLIKIQNGVTRYKTNVNSTPAYSRIYWYNSSGQYKGVGGTSEMDDDGYWTFDISAIDANNVTSFCVIMDNKDIGTLRIAPYDDFYLQSPKVEIPNLILSDKTKDDLKLTLGKSAYQIAVDNGFNGTEAEWLESLKGDSGSEITVDNIDFSSSAWSDILNNII